MKKLLLVSVLGLAGLAAAPSYAESTFNGAAVTGSAATARLDFSVVIPQVLFLRVGTSSGNTATDGTINGIAFTPTAVNIGTGAAVAATAASGDLTNGAVTVRVYGNAPGNISLNSATTGALSNGVAGQTIPWSQITVAPAALAAPTAGYTVGAVAHPAFNLAAAGGAGTAVALVPTAGVVRVEGRWTFSYANTNVVPAGTYGTNTAGRNGRVTYTATQL